MTTVWIVEERNGKFAIQSHHGDQYDERLDLSGCGGYESMKQLAHQICNQLNGGEVDAAATYRAKIQTMREAEDLSRAAFEKVWATYTARGYNYGEDALESVYFGWKIAQDRYTPIGTIEHWPDDRQPVGVVFTEDIKSLPDGTAVFV